MIFGCTTQHRHSGHKFVPIQVLKTILVLTWKLHRLPPGQETVPPWHTTMMRVASTSLVVTILAVRCPDYVTSFHTFDSLLSERCLEIQFDFHELDAADIGVPEFLRKLPCFGGCRHGRCLSRDTTYHCHRD